MHINLKKLKWHELHDGGVDMVYRGGGFVTIEEDDDYWIILNFLDCLWQLDLYAQ